MKKKKKRKNTRGLLLADWSASWLHGAHALRSLRSCTPKTKKKERSYMWVSRTLMLALSRRKIRAWLKTDGPTIGTYVREKLRCCEGRGESRTARGRKRRRRERKGRTDENAAGKSYRDTANPRHGTWATVLHLRARVCVRACIVRRTRVTPRHLRISLAWKKISCLFLVFVLEMTRWRVSRRALATTEWIQPVLYKPAWTCIT